MVCSQGRPHAESSRGGHYKGRDCWPRAWTDLRDLRAPVEARWRRSFVLPLLLDRLSYHNRLGGRRW